MVVVFKELDSPPEVSDFFTLTGLHETFVVYCDQLHPLLDKVHLHTVFIRIEARASISFVTFLTRSLNGAGLFSKPASIIL